MMRLELVQLLLGHGCRVAQFMLFPDILHLFLHDLVLIIQLLIIGNGRLSVH